MKLHLTCTGDRLGLKFGFSFHGKRHTSPMVGAIKAFNDVTKRAINVYLLIFVDKMIGIPGTFIFVVKTMAR